MEEKVIMALAFVAGMIVDILIHFFNSRRIKFDGVLNIDSSDESKDRYLLLFYIPTGEVSKRKKLSIRVDNVGPETFNNLIKMQGENNDV